MNTSKRHYGLALHTSTGQLGLACGDGKQSMRAAQWSLDRDMALQLLPLLQEFVLPLDWSDFCWLAVAQGPGSFTSTRIGVTVARTLAQQLDCPVFGISSLAAAVWQRGPYPLQTEIAVSLAARRQQQFGAIYRFMGVAEPLEPLICDRTYDQADWEAILRDYPHAQQLSLHPPFGHTVGSLHTLAAGRWEKGDRPHWSEVLPYYGQNPVN